MAEANRRFYVRIADLYSSHRVVRRGSRRPGRARNRHQPGPVSPYLPSPASSLKALDACGGSGNVALKLLARGLDVTSPIFPESSSTSSNAKRRRPATVPGRIAARSLRSSNPPTPRSTSSSSSALHHLQDIDRVLTLVFQRLRPGGLLFTLHDPTARAHQGRLTPFLLRAEYFAFKFFKQPGDVPAAALRKLRRARAALPAKASCRMTILGWSRNTIFATASTTSLWSSVCAASDTK